MLSPPTDSYRCLKILCRVREIGQFKIDNTTQQIIQSVAREVPLEGGNAQHRNLAKCVLRRRVFPCIHHSALDPEFEYEGNIGKFF